MLVSQASCHQVLSNGNAPSRSYGGWKGKVRAAAGLLAGSHDVPSPVGLCLHVVFSLCMPLCAPASSTWKDTVMLD